jgi:two-component system KDP operon response regulator KdpE
MRSDLVLVCDPSPQARRALRVILRSARYEVVMTATGRDALDAVARERPQAVILELALPDFDGIEVLRRLRRRIDGPIIVLSAIDDTERKIAALTRGADDYITKPFSPGELLARLAARLRSAPSALRIEDNGLVIDLVAQRVTLDGEEVQLTATEFALLRVLATSRGTVSNRTLARKVWGMRRGDIGPRVRAHVANLRAKLDHPDRSSVIRNDIGLGYRFVGYAGTEGDPSVPVTGDHDAGL